MRALHRFDGLNWWSYANRGLCHLVVLCLIIQSTSDDAVRVTLKQPVYTLASVLVEIPFGIGPIHELLDRSQLATPGQSMTIAMTPIEARKMT
jgi:hypothetical protein